MGGPRQELVEVLSGLARLNEEWKELPAAREIMPFLPRFAPLPMCAMFEYTILAADVVATYVEFGPFINDAMAMAGNGPRNVAPLRSPKFGLLRETRLEDDFWFNPRWMLLENQTAARGNWRVEITNAWAANNANIRLPIGLQGSANARRVLYTDHPGGYGSTSGPFEFAIIQIPLHAYFGFRVYETGITAGDKWTIAMRVDLEWSPGFWRGMT